MSRPSAASTKAPRKATTVVPNRQQAQVEEADPGVDQTERDVGEAAEAMAAHNQAGQPAGNARRDDPRDAAARVQGDIAESKRRQRRQMFDAHAAHSNTTSRYVSPYSTSAHPYGCMANTAPPLTGPS